MLAFGQFLEVFISGLLAGVLYSLVALGFVLIFKASGVFNFAQGAMVLLAGLALVRSLDFLVAKGFPVWTAIVLGLLFYLTVTPVGFVLRLTGKDPLRLRRDSAANSYWILREPPGPAAESMKHQF